MPHYLYSCPKHVLFPSRYAWAGRFTHSKSNVVNLSSPLRPCIMTQYVPIFRTSRTGTQALPKNNVDHRQQLVPDSHRLGKVKVTFTINKTAIICDFSRAVRAWQCITTQSRRGCVRTLRTGNASLWKDEASKTTRWKKYHSNITSCIVLTSLRASSN